MNSIFLPARCAAVVDWSALNGAVFDTFCDKVATWSGQAINVALTIAPTVDGKNYQIGGELITAQCPYAGIEAMKRKDALTIDGIGYIVMDVRHDGHGWAEIVLEKA